MPLQCTTRACHRCGESKPLSAFYHLSKSQGYGYKSTCKPCYSEINNRSVAIRREAKRQTAVKTCPHCHQSKLLLEYGLNQQVCQVCQAAEEARKHLPPPERRPVLDPKPCRTCHQIKPLSSYYRAAGMPDGRTLDCKDCLRVMHAKPRRDANLRSRYGLDSISYQHLLASQDGRCAICGQEPNGTPLHVDHDHVTGKVRGLLCVRCNVVLGLLESESERVEKAIAYASRSSA